MSGDDVVGGGGLGRDDGAMAAEDEILLAELRVAASHYDPPPPLLPEALQALLSWRDPDAELALLVADSRELAGSVRGGDDDVLLRFEAPPYAVTFEASPDGNGQYRVTGQVEPGGPGEVHVHQGEPAPGGHDLHVTCDDWGRFEAYPVAPGPISLRLQPGSGQAVRTAWVIL